MTAMPPCTIEHQDNPVIWMTRRYFIQKYLHAIAINLRQDNCIQFAISDRYRSVSIDIFLCDHCLA